MKVWLDIRSLNEHSHYGSMMLKVIKKLVEVDNKNEYILYTHHSIWLEKHEKVTPIKPWDAFGDLKISKQFKQESFALMVFFDHRVPLFYKEDFIVMIPSLKESFFMWKDFLAREIYNHYMAKTISRAKKVICFEKYTASELNERLNVNEKKIQIMNPFFHIKPKKALPEAIHIDIKSKYNLQNDYLIYDGWSGANKNIENLLKTFSKLNWVWSRMHLFIIWEDTAKDTDLRDIVITKKLQDRVEFISHINAKEEIFYYQQSKGIIFPSIYESFPFDLKKAISYWVPILSSDIWAIRWFMWDHIDYFNPKSTYDMWEAIEKFLRKKKQPDYTDIFSDYTLPKTIKQFYSIIMKS